MSEPRNKMVWIGIFGGLTFYIYGWLITALSGMTMGPAMS